jgi:type III pantothenate kinase
MNLAIDQGNTLTKVAIFEGDELRHSLSYPSFDIPTIRELYASYDIKRAILSSVGETKPELIDFLEETSFFINLTHLTPLPIKNDYKTPETLGKDRLAAIVGGNYLKPKQALLVIDAGTAITFDVITTTGIYRGGNISPGIDMRLKALHSYTKKLPLIPWQETTSEIGYDTPSAIWNGVINGLVYEIDGYITSQKNTHPDLFTFLTGGNAFFFESKLKNSIFAVENLVLIGLNRILNYNA